MSAIARAPKLGPLMTAMLTPFDAAGAVDEREARRLARFLVDEGTQGLVVCGTTGEAPALSEEEQLSLISAVKDEVGERVGIVAGTGANNTAHTIEFTQKAEAYGVDAALVVVPYYNKPTQDGMLKHFGAVAEKSSLPIVVYNIPGRTGTNMLPETLLELARRHHNIAGVKESTADCAQFSEILRQRPEGFGFWAGDDHMYLPSLALGGDGLISTSAHLCARELRALGEAFAAGDTARAAELHLSLTPLFAALFSTTSPIPVKWAMRQLGFALGECRSPLGEMPQTSIARVAPLLEAYRARAHAATSLVR
jgi:4-hydroxy-tetrahydrodipicolinate synthase